MHKKFRNNKNGKMSQNIKIENNLLVLILE
jgi:hypothetical protein